jgi:hypothetical protein
MPVKININVNPEDIARVNLFLNDIKADVVMRRAINDTLSGIKTDAARAVSADLNLTQARIKKNFYTRGTDGSDISGMFVSKGDPVNLASFSGFRTGNNTGFSVKIKRSGAWHHFKHGFVWTRVTKSGDVAVTAFQRAWTGARTSSSNKLPWKKFYPGNKPAHERRKVETLRGPRIEDILGKPEILSGVEALATDRLHQNILDQLDRIFEGHR